MMADALLTDTNVRLMPCFICYTHQLPVLARMLTLGIHWQQCSYAACYDTLCCRKYECISLCCSKDEHYTGKISTLCCAAINQATELFCSSFVLWKAAHSCSS